MCENARKDENNEIGSQGHLCRVSQPWGAAAFCPTPKLALIASQADVNVSVK